MILKSVEINEFLVRQHLKAKKSMIVLLYQTPNEEVCLYMTPITNEENLTNGQVRSTKTDLITTCITYTKCDDHDAWSVEFGIRQWYRENHKSILDDLRNRRDYFDIAIIREVALGIKRLRSVKPETTNEFELKLT